MPNVMHCSAERFLRKTLSAPHTQTPRVINVDKNAAYTPAIDQLQADEQLPETTQLRQVKYLNNQVEPRPSIYQTLSQARYGIWFL